MALHERTVVKVTRVKAPVDLSPVENFIGFLVDEQGNAVMSPVVGDPIFLAGDKDDDKPWLFRTDTVYAIQVFNRHWMITTEQGTVYLVENERDFQ